MKFGYADPPYLGCCGLYGHRHDEPYRCWDLLETHEVLISNLARCFPDGWALSTGAKMLPDILRLCPSDVRVLAWVKTDAPPFTIRVQYTWEPVILCGGRPYDGGPRTVRDSLVAPSCGAMGSGVHRNTAHVIGRKPPRFCRWLFDCLGAGPGDTLEDWFPGSGDVLRHWRAFESQGVLALSPNDSSGT
jgi:hypothetical protein